MPTIEAHVTAVQKDEATGWYRITTDHERIKRLDTKRENKAREAAGLKKSGELAVIEFTSNPRHDEQTGRTYQNNYYERAVARDGAGGADDDGIESVTPTQRPTDPGTAWRISLAVGIKAAIDMLPELAIDANGNRRSVSFQQLKQVALAWGEFAYYTPLPRQSGFGQSSSGTPSPTSDELATVGALQDIADEGGGSYMHSDDDIPFGVDDL